ncbi:nucleotidyltransferase family protein [Vibrio navarrensis]|uniref:nucleotidyltransferase domain-containing protein n=1 Tax=Vibrio navarrensis TaxID=29495 RepID=UPI001869D62C|nr:nucleotidyltransferase domain-containing protein [Vibrio navarrensis]EJK2115915.1 nucleotidyltransferase domain-containing protein [Vibrio navarrensis]MBE4598616.1 nucleotidyltransferase [Vibrio navarrensis]MBE4606219.1 nucleotidyltransferase [Vibrio navarrensis]MBE4610110.1 nucleotidyltransferase [Vibrio navarrensis]
MTLPVIDPKTPFQSEFQPVINDVLMCLKSGLGQNLHSVYVYGSVARKTAIAGLSNLDLVVVTHRPFTENRATVLNTLKWSVQKGFPQVSGVAVKTAEVKEIASLDSLFTWGFMLKHCCVCIYGNDLAECFGEYVPSWEIAKHWNMDVEDWLAVYRNKIARASTPELLVTNQKIIAKKLLRASYSLIMHKDQQWFDDPIECGRHFVQYHPEKSVEIRRLTILLSGKLIEKRSVIGLLDSFGDWLVKQYQKTEFKIG